MKRLDQIRERATAYEQHGTPGLAAPHDRKALLSAVDAGREVMEQLEAIYPSGRIWADKYRAAITTALEGDQP